MRITPNELMIIQMSSECKRQLFAFCKDGYLRCPDTEPLPPVMQTILSMGNPPLAERSKDDPDVLIPTDELKQIVAKAQAHPYHPNQTPMPQGIDCGAY